MNNCFSSISVLSGLTDLQQSCSQARTSASELEETGRKQERAKPLGKRLEPNLNDLVGKISRAIKY